MRHTRWHTGALHSTHTHQASPPGGPSPLRGVRRPRRALLRHRPCPEGHLQDVQRPEGALQGIATGTQAPLAGRALRAPPAKRAKPATPHRINHTDSMITGGSGFNVLKGTFEASSHPLTCRVRRARGKYAKDHYQNKLQAFDRNRRLTIE